MSVNDMPTKAEFPVSSASEVSWSMSFQTKPSVISGVRAAATGRPLAYFAAKAWIACLTSSWSLAPEATLSPLSVAGDVSAAAFTARSSATVIRLTTLEIVATFASVS